MSCFKLVRVNLDDNVSKVEILENIRLPAVLGRGALLKCREKKVSRSHATLDWDNEGIMISSTHKLPTFVETSSGKKTLNLGESAVLKNGDKFGLLADSFWYEIFLNNIPEVNDEGIMKNTEVKEITCDDAETLKTESTIEIDNHSALNSHLAIENKNPNFFNNKNSADDCEPSKDNIECISVNIEKKADIVVFKNINISEEAEVTEKTNLIENSKIQPTYNNNKQRQLPKWLTSIQSSTHAETKESYGNKNLEPKENHSHGRKIKNIEVCKIPEVKAKMEKPSTSTSVTKNSSKLPVSKNKQYHTISQEIEDVPPTENNKDAEASCFIKTNDSSSVAEVNDLKDNKEKKKNDNIKFDDKNKELSECLNSVSNIDPFLNQNVKLSSSPTKKSNASNSDEGKDNMDVSDDRDDEKPRQSCLYGENCFRRNPHHKKEYAHPNDNDYIPPKDINQDEDSDDERPQCEHGVDCYRKNPQHKKDFKHTRLPQPRRRAKIAKRKRDEDDSEDEYDMDDPFLNDDSSDDYAPTDSDTDSPFDNDGVEENDTKRLLKEAKKFTKKKRS